jgi:cell wall-associated NlpC family hydrolase
VRRALIAVLLACWLAGCGEVGRQDAGVVQAWKVEDPYLPPPDPSSYRRAEVPAAAARPRTAAPDAPVGGAPSDAEVTADLERAYGGRGGTDLDAAAISSDGLAVIPDTAPPKLVALMHAANDVARKPYVYGGGHGRNAGEVWADSAYDCSGSVSYALAAAGYLKGPETSGTLMSFGKSGPGRWVTIYANAGHAFMVVAGLRFDTSGRQITGTRWQDAKARSYAGFTVRHPIGL